MTPKYAPPLGFIQINSKLEGITVYAPELQSDITPESLEFKCPQCGATTAFTPSEGSVTCSRCGYAQDRKIETVGKNADEREFTLENLAIAVRGWGTERSELHCESCGADLSIAANDLSSTCPFCASNHVLARVSTQEFLRPRHMIPFKLESQDCNPRVKKWLGKGWMHPSDLSHVTGSTQFRGVYLPFWTFDATVIANWRAEVGYERTERYYDNSSKSWKTRTRVDWRWESGQIIQNPDDWLGMGTSRISHKLLDRLNPFNLGELVRYKPDYLAGWQALNYDIPLQDSWDQVKAKMRERAREACRNQITSNHVRNFSLLADFNNESWRLILLPVYAATYHFGGETFQVIVNGQTGSVAGQKPVAWWKVWLAIAGLQTPALFMALLGLLLLLFGGIGILALGLGAILFVVGIVVSIHIFRQATLEGEV